MSIPQTNSVPNVDHCIEQPANTLPDNRTGDNKSDRSADHGPCSTSRNGLIPYLPNRTTANRSQFGDNQKAWLCDEFEGLDPKQVDKLRKEFQKYDKTGNNRLTERQFAALVFGRCYRARSSGIMENSFTSRKLGGPRIPKSPSRGSPIGSPVLEPFFRTSNNEEISADPLILGAAIPKQGQDDEAVEQMLSNARASKQGVRRRSFSSSYSSIALDVPDRKCRSDNECARTCAREVFENFGLLRMDFPNFVKWDKKEALKVEQATTKMAVESSIWKVKKDGDLPRKDASKPARSFFTFLWETKQPKAPVTVTKPGFFSRITSEIEPTRDVK